MHIEWTAAEIRSKVLKDFCYLHFERSEPLSKGISALDILNEVGLTALIFPFKLSYPTVLQYA